MSKQLSQLKKKMDQLESSFVEKTGYRPSQADKMTNPEMLSLLTEQNRIKKEFKNLRENVDMKENENNKKAEKINRSIDDIKESLRGIEKKLEEKKL